MDDSFFSYSCRVEEGLFCGSCGKELLENEEWEKRSDGRIALRGNAILPRTITQSKGADIP